MMMMRAWIAIVAMGTVLGLPAGVMAAQPDRPQLRSCPPAAGYMPIGLQQAAEVLVELELDRRGEVRSARVVRSSGSAAVDSAGQALAAACLYERPGRASIRLVERFRFEPND
jgi:TonB family protein